MMIFFYEPKSEVFDGLGLSVWECLLVCRV